MKRVEQKVKKKIIDIILLKAKLNNGHAQIGGVWVEEKRATENIKVINCYCYEDHFIQLQLVVLEDLDKIKFKVKGLLRLKWFLKQLEGVKKDKV